MADLESMTVKAAADCVQVSESTVRRWLRSGRLTGRKVERGGPGGSWEVDAASVERLAVELNVEANAPVTAAVNTQALLAEIRGLREEVRRLSEQVDALPKALPPAREVQPEATAKTTWWQRLIRRGNGG